MFYFRRIINYHLANTYLPTMSLLAIAELTLFFGESKQDIGVSLSLTILLVMYTFYQSISNSIPKTAYLKLMDYWLIFCLLVPFLVFLIQSFWYLNEHKTTKIEKFQRSKITCNKMSKRKLVQLATVGFTVAFIFVYFAVAVYLYKLY
jgi:hypothetical protein